MKPCLHCQKPIADHPRLGVVCEDCANKVLAVYGLDNEPMATFHPPEGIADSVLEIGATIHARTLQPMMQMVVQGDDSEGEDRILEKFFDRAEVAKLHVLLGDFLLKTEPKIQEKAA